MKLWFERGAWASKKGRERISRLSPSEVRRIAVIRHAALGDMVLVRPFLLEARRFFPNAEIVLSLVSNYTYGAPTDLVDSVHILHGSDQKSVSLVERIARARELGSVDLLFDLADTTRSRYLCLLANAKVKIGFPYRWYLRNLLFDAAVPRSDFSFEAVNMLDMLMLLGANPAVPLDFGWPNEPAQHASNPSERKIIYFPFASVDSKCWPRDSFVNLIVSAADQFPNYDHVVLGGIGGQESEQQYASLRLANSKIKLQKALPLIELLRLLHGSDLVVANDTGVRNLAISLQVPTVGIFFSTVPYRYWPRWGYHEAVFTSDGRPPQTRDVLQSMRKALMARSVMP